MKLNLNVHTPGGGGCIVSNRFKTGLGTKFGCLKVIFSWSVENMFGLVMLFKISRNWPICKVLINN